MVIENYSFGRIVIDKKTYHSDVIIFPDGRIKDSWWRETGHRLSEKDIEDLIETRPDIIIAGTGASGLMIPRKDLKEQLSQKGIEFRAAPSKKACKLFNELVGKKRVGACFHLTC